jgi:hypothetical protein
MNRNKWARVIATVAIGGLSLIGMFALLQRALPVVRATSQVRYVSTTRVDQGDCGNSSAPCRTIQCSVDQAAEGDEVRVATGVYTDVTSATASSKSSMSARP